MNLSPAIERQIERVLILAGKPVMRRPIPAAVVLDALSSACEQDEAACEEVRRYLQRYMNTLGLTSADLQLSASAGDGNIVLPNRHGELLDSPWRASASAYYQPNDYIIVNAGGVAYDGNATPTGSFVSVGFDFAQLDIGFRDHWLSPLSDSSSLIGTEAPTMPSATLSNYDPISPLGISYELFAAQMSRQNGIVFQDTTTTGNPRLSGLQLSAEPFLGYGVSVNRVTQYGGGARGGSGFSDWKDTLFTTSNRQDASGAIQATNRVAALASSIQFPGSVPFAVSIEYAGEDNAFAEGYRLGATNISLGLDLPRLGRSFDATFEVSEWQNSWYVHNLYPEGLTNRDRVIGHWFGDQRVAGDAIGGDSQMLRVGWRRTDRQYITAEYRTLALDPRWVRFGAVPPYERFHALKLGVATDWRNVPLDFELLAGKDIFGESFGRLSASVDFMARDRFSSRVIDADSGGGRGGVELFVDAGANRSKTLKILAIGTPSDPAARGTGAHIGFGARRQVSTNGDLGVRVEIDEIDEHRMLSLRALDYRYHVWKVAFGAFLGVARYDYGLATNGYYWGAGITLRDVLPKWDIGFDVRHYEKLNRDKSLPSDPLPTAESHPRLYIDVDGTTLYVTRRW